jgi:hypothetical protein
MADEMIMMFVDPDGVPPPPAPEGFAEPPKKKRCPARRKR